VTDPQTSYERRDELRAQDHDAIQAMLRMMGTALEVVRDVNRTVEAMRERADKREERAEVRYEALRQEIALIRQDNARQDRVQQHDGAVAEEALTVAQRKEVGRHAMLIGGGVATITAAALQFVIGPIIAQLTGG